MTNTQILTQNYVLFKSYKNWIVSPINEVLSDRIFQYGLLLNFGMILHHN